MDINFQFEGVSTVFLIRDHDGRIIREPNRLVPDSFYYMTPIRESSIFDNNIYIDNNSNTVWQKNVSYIAVGGYQYIQEEYIDITKLWGRIQHLLDKTKRDPLTKISNISAVNDMKKHILLAKKNCVVAIIDINDFKMINDEFGHGVGDKALIEVSKLFEKMVYGSKDLVARVGGDEFLFLFNTDDIKSIMIMMEELQEQVLDLGNSIGIPLSISVGISLFKHGNKWDDIIKQADSALYYVKKHEDGKNNIAYFNPDSGMFELYKESFNKILMLDKKS